MRYFPALVLLIMLVTGNAYAATGQFINGLQNVGQEAYQPTGELRNQSFDLTEPRSPLTIAALIINALLGLVGVILLALVVYHGFRWILAAGNPEKVKQAQQALLNAGIGLLIVLGAFSLTYFITSRIESAVRGPQYQPGTNVEIPQNVQLKFEL